MPTTARTTHPSTDPRRIMALPAPDSSVPMLFSTRWNTGSTFHIMVRTMITSNTPSTRG